MRVGQKVIFLGASEEQINWGGNDDPNQICRVGNTYTVAEVEVHSWHIKIRLIGCNGKFNDASFKDANEKIKHIESGWTRPDGETFYGDKAIQEQAEYYEQKLFEQTEYYDLKISELENKS